MPQQIPHDGRGNVPLVLPMTDEQPKSDCARIAQSVTIPIEQYRLLIEQFKNEVEAQRRSVLAALRGQDKLLKQLGQLLDKTK